jgi:hypothetical protein
VLAVAALTACSSRATPTASPGSDGQTGAPLATSVDTALGNWATFPMGHLDDPTNTFWEEFTLPAGADKWVERTPPDVADNGGLVAAPTSTGVVVGFRPSDLLSFSPLASTTDGGVTYTPGLLPGGLADVPDALSVAPGGRAAAIVGTAIVTSPSPLSGWQPSATLAAISASPAARACGVREITAVTITDSNPFIGAACSATGVVGLFEQAGSTFRSVGPSLPGVTGHVQVLRLVHADQGLAALLGITTGSGTSYVAAWNSTPTSATWTISAPLAVSGQLTSSAVTSGAGFAVLTTNSGTALSASVITGPGASWAQLAAPPTGTATVAVSESRTDALVVDSATFIDYRLVSGNWVKAQTVQVAVPYGSSG